MKSSRALHDGVYERFETSIRVQMVQLGMVFDQMVQDGLPRLILYVSVPVGVNSLAWEVLEVAGQRPRSVFAHELGHHHVSAFEVHGMVFPIPTPGRVIVPIKVTRGHRASGGLVPET